MRTDDPLYSATAQAPGWLVAEPLDPAVAQQVADFNLRGLRMQLADLSGSAASPLQESSLPCAVRELQPLWRALGQSAVQRLAGMPFLLFECGLDSLPLFSGAAVRRPVTAQDPQRLEFASMVLNYAWHLARANPLGAAVGLGMPGVCAAALRELAFGDVQARAVAAAASLRLRWCERPAVWRPLLAVVTSGVAADLEREQLAGLRRLAGELMRADAAGRAGRISEPLW